MMEKIFITGAGGFIGTHLTTRLVNDGYNVTVLIKELDKNSLFYMNSLDKSTKLYFGDLRDYNEMERIIREEQVDTVYHLAAQSQVQRAYRDPLSTLDINIRGTCNILEACRKNDIARVIIASSDKAYGIAKKLPYNEDAELKGCYPYDVSKSCIDLISQSYFKTYGLPVAITRCANTFGPGDLNWDRLIPSVIRWLINKEEILIRSDGMAERDYMYIDDCVDAYVKIALRILDSKGEAFNFGRDKPISVLDLVKLLIDISGRRVEPKVLGEAKGEIDRQFLDSTKAHEKLKWKAKIPLIEGLRLTYRWYEKTCK